VIVAPLIEHPFDVCFLKLGRRNPWIRLAISKKTAYSAGLCFVPSSKARSVRPPVKSFYRRTFLEIETSVGQRPVLFSYLRNYQQWQLEQ
jgi:hypothetical protein